MECSENDDVFVVEA